MLILAVEPDPAQAAHVATIAGSLRAELVIRHSAGDALKALAGRVPDLVLTSPLLSWHDEAALSERLRELGDAAAHVQTLTIPILAEPRPAARRRSVLSAMRRTRDKGASPDGCDPAVFAQQIREYLARTDAVDDPVAQEPEIQEPVVLEIVVHGLVEARVEEPVEEPVEERVDEPVDDGFRLTSPAEYDFVALADQGPASDVPEESLGFAPLGEAWDDHPALDFAAPADPIVEVVPVFEPDVVVTAADDVASWIVVPLEAVQDIAVDPAVELPPSEDVWVLEMEAIPDEPAEPAAPIATAPPAAPEEEIEAPPPSPPRKKAARPKKKALQDEWGFFDPDQCGFAALLEKLDEVTDEGLAEAETTVRVVTY